MAHAAEIPEYFICPISLQIMQEPVTTITGITYDKTSIEQWLSTAKDATCPVTNQPLPRGSILTPNHTLHRLIQAWRSGGAASATASAPPTQYPSLCKSHVLKLMRDLTLGDRKSELEALKAMEAFATKSQSNRKSMVQAGAVAAVASYVIRCYKEGTAIFPNIERALRTLDLIWTPSAIESSIRVEQHYDFIEAITWILECKTDALSAIKSQALVVLKFVMEAASPSAIEHLKPEFFVEIIRAIRAPKTTPRAIKAGLHVLIETCNNCTRNRMRIVDARGVFDLIELEINQEMPENRITEPIFRILAQLCSCAEGRAQFLEHAGAIALVTKRLLRVSAAADIDAIRILGLVSKFSGTSEVILEMLRVGAVSKICMVLQADCEVFLKDKAREVLRLHSGVWADSPCIALYLLTRDYR